MKKLFTLLTAILLLSGCSVPSSPPTEEIDKGVNWVLSAYIDRNYPDRNLFDSYKITNQYTEKRNDGVAYVYDFEADCLVHTVFHVGGSNPNTGWGQALPAGDSRTTKFSPGNIRRFKGTVTLIQKGNVWYPQETIR